MMENYVHSDAFEYGGFEKRLLTRTVSTVDPNIVRKLAILLDGNVKSITALCGVNKVFRNALDELMVVMQYEACRRVEFLWNKPSKDKRVECLSSMAMDNMFIAAVSSTKYYRYRYLIKKLVMLGADVNIRSLTAPMGALHYAAVHGDVEMAKILMSAGADVTKEFINGGTPFMFARSTNTCDNSKMIMFLKGLMAEQYVTPLDIAWGDVNSYLEKLRSMYPGYKIAEKKVPTLPADSEVQKFLEGFKRIQGGRLKRGDDDDEEAEIQIAIQASLGESKKFEAFIYNVECQRIKDEWLKAEEDAKSRRLRQEEIATELNLYDSEVSERSEDDSNEDEDTRVARELQASFDRK